MVRLIRSVQRAFWPACKILIAAGLLAWLLARVPWRDGVVQAADGTVSRCPGLLSTLRGVQPGWLGLGLLSMSLSILVAALRWRLLLRGQGVPVPVRTVVGLGFLGEFCGSALPGMIGGDLVKAYSVARAVPRKSPVIVSVLVDRLMGVCGLGLLALAALPVAWRLGADRGSLRVAAFSVCAVFAAVGTGGAFLFSARVRRALHIERFAQRLPFGRYLPHLLDALRSHGLHARGTLWGAIGLTFAAHALTVLAVACVGRSLALGAGWHSYFLYVPLILAISAVPITPGGLGVMEELYVLYFAAGAGVSGGVALALLARFVMMLSVLPGAVVLLAGPRLPGARAVAEQFGACESAGDGQGPL